VSNHYGVIAFREAVWDFRRDHGSHAIYDQKCVQGTAVSGTEVLAGGTASTWRQQCRRLVVHQFHSIPTDFIHTVARQHIQLDEERNCGE